MTKKSDKKPVIKVKGHTKQGKSGSFEVGEYERTNPNYESEKLKNSSPADQILKKTPQKSNPLSTEKTLRVIELAKQLISVDETLVRDGDVTHLNDENLCDIVDFYSLRENPEIMKLNSKELDLFNKTSLNIHNDEVKLIKQDIRRGEVETLVNEHCDTVSYEKSIELTHSFLNGNPNVFKKEVEKAFSEANFNPSKEEMDLVKEGILENTREFYEINLERDEDETDEEYREKIKSCTGDVSGDLKIINYFMKHDHIDIPHDAYIILKSCKRGIS